MDPALLDDLEVLTENMESILKRIIVLREREKDRQLKTTYRGLGRAFDKFIDRVVDITSSAAN